MPKYRVVRYSEMQETWWIKADSEEEAFHIACETEPDDMGPVGNSDMEVELDDSLDEAEESSLKEQSWRNGSINWRKDVR